LIFATQSNVIVEVFFDRCYFQKDKTIEVKKSHSDFLSHLGNFQVRAFDTMRDIHSGEEYFVLGTALPVQRNDQAAQMAIDQSLSFISRRNEIKTLRHQQDQTRSWFNPLTHLSSMFGAQPNPDQAKFQQV
jgi:hypothetical protein